MTLSVAQTRNSLLLQQFGPAVYSDGAVGVNLPNSGSM